MIDFFGKRKIFYILSTCIVLIAIIGSIYPGVKLDVEFKGGSMVTYSYTGNLDKTAVANTATQVVGTKVDIRETEDVQNNKKNIIVSTAGTNSISMDKLNELTKKLQETYKDSKIEYVQNFSVDATIGNEFLFKCSIAVMFAALIIILYITVRFSKIGGFSAGITGVIALVHDAIVIYAVYLLFRIPLSGNFMAVVLTILGYSINDTIVIYDRIRENEKTYGNKMRLDDLVNKSINQSLIRSINTSITTIISLAVVVIVGLIYNVDSIVTFAFPLAIGMVSGVYSTIFIAGPLWVDWNNYKQKRDANKNKKFKAYNKLRGDKCRPFLRCIWF